VRCTGRDWAAATLTTIGRTATAPAGRDGTARAVSAWLRLQAVIAGSAESRSVDTRTAIRMFKAPKPNAFRAPC